MGSVISQAQAFKTANIEEVGQVYYRRSIVGVVCLHHIYLITSCNLISSYPLSSCVILSWAIMSISYTNNMITNDNDL